MGQVAEVGGAWTESVSGNSDATVGAEQRAMGGRQNHSIDWCTRLMAMGRFWGLDIFV